jgi:hypothetical protein
MDTDTTWMRTRTSTMKLKDFEFDVRYRRKSSSNIPHNIGLRSLQFDIRGSDVRLRSAVVHHGYRS